MRKVYIAVVIALLGVGAFVYAQAPGYGPGWGMGPGMGWGQGYGPGMMGQGWGPGMMGGYHGPWGGPGYGPGAEGISLDQAKEIAKQYTEKYLNGFTVERVLPSTGMRHTMYGVEVKGPKREIRYLRINPWGGVMPFAGGPLDVQ